MLLDWSHSADDGSSWIRLTPKANFITDKMYLFLYYVVGFLIDFISGPVNSGFTSAVAILIVASQIKDLIGIKAAGTTLMDMIISISKDITHYRLGDTLFGIICIVVILLLRVRKALKYFINN